jgi:HD-like signal output (HDOD) protein
VAPHDFRRALEYARATSIPLHEAEQKMLGLTHCESGSILARNWGLPAELAEVIAHHHSAGRALLNPALTSMIAVSDLLCRLHGIGHGYSEPMQADFSQQPAFRILAAHCPALADFDLSRFTFETGAMLEEIHTVVSSVYRVAQ